MAASTSTMDSRQRFANLDSDDYEQLLNKKDSENTHKATRISVSIFKDYLREKNLNTEFEQLDKPDLANILRKFYLEVRKVDGDYYKRASLLAIRQGLNRHLKKPDGKEVRIIVICFEIAHDAVMKMHQVYSWVGVIMGTVCHAQSSLSSNGITGALSLESEAQVNTAQLNSSFQ